MKRPTYAWGDHVEFRVNGDGETLEGMIEIVDAGGTFGQSEEPSYDIYVKGEKNCLYKHVRESWIRRKLVKESVIRGILKYHEQENTYGVLYSRDGYEVKLDNPVFTEIRATLSDQWVSVCLAPLKDWVEQSVEIRYVPLYLMVSDLVHSHQDSTDMVYEVYWEDANVVLQDDSFMMWEPEKLILRGYKHHVSTEYYNERVYRWDVTDGIMRLCLGPVHDPDPETIEDAECYEKILRDRFRKIPEVDPEKVRVVERIRIEEFHEIGLKRMISHANTIGREKGTEILTAVSSYGFEYRKEGEWHKVYYQAGFICDAIVSEE